MEWAQVMLLVLGGFLSIWGLSLIARAIGMRVERAAGKRVKAGGKPVRSSVAGRQVLGVRGATRAAMIALALGVLSLAAGAGLGWLLVGHERTEMLTNWTLGAVLAGIFAGVLAVAGWWFDPALGRGRCPKCWYDMPDAAASRDFQSTCCPECGLTISRQDDLYRTRRKSGMLWMGVIAALLAYPIYMGEGIRARGATVLIPSTLLIAFFESAPRSWIVERANGSDSLVRRTLWDWQDSWLTRRVNHIMESSTDVSSLMRVLEFRYCPWIFASPERFVKLAEAVFDADRGRADEALTVLHFMGPEMSSVLPRSEILAAHAADLNTMITTGNPAEQEIALRLIESAGVAFDPYIGSLVTLAQVVSPVTEVSYGACKSLAGLSKSSEKALQAFIQLYHDNPSKRGEWIHAAGRIREFRKEVRDLIRLWHSPGE